MSSNRKSRDYSPGGAPRRVVVALRMAGIAGQDKLNGIFDFLSEGRRWQLIIYRTKHEFTADVVEHELSRGTDGFIVGIPGTDDALGVLAATDIPTVVLNVSGGDIEQRKGRIAFIKSDSQAVGREAAHALLKQGIYKSYGYAGYRTDDDWSRERGTAFRDALEKAGFVGRMMDIAHYRDKVEDKAANLKWLKNLPKPCGILAACDDRAFEILDLCRGAGIKVPAEVGILGVNNDPILCENAEPRLSSVYPDFVEEGRLAAELLGKMMSGGLIPAERRLREVGIRTVVHRESTVAQSEAGRLVQKVLAYIEDNGIADNKAAWDAYPAIAKMINELSEQYGITVIVNVADRMGELQVNGKTVGTTASGAKQTGFGLAQTAIVAGAATATLAGAFVVARKNRLFA